MILSSFGEVLPSFCKVPIALTVSLMSCLTFPISMLTASAEFLKTRVFHSFQRIQAIAPGIKFQALLTKGLEDMDVLHWLSES